MIVRSLLIDASIPLDVLLKDLGDETGELAGAVEEPEVEEAVTPRVRPAPDMSAYDRAVKAYVEGLAAEGRLIGPDGKLYAHASTTCFIFDAP
jgi:hypothetical protein